MPWKRNSIALTDADSNQIRLYLEHHYGLTSERCISIGMDVAANKNSYHPICDRLEMLQWDGTPRIRFALHHFLGAEVSDYTEEVMRMHMMAAISLVYKTGCKYDIALCLVGQQGGGKSTFFRFLAINDDWFTDDLRRLENKRVFEKMNGHWIVELMPEDTSIGQVEDYLENNHITRTCVKEIYCKVYGHYATDEVPNWESKKITEILHSLGWTDIGSRKFREYGSQKAWEPAEKTEEPDLFSGFKEVTEDEADIPEEWK